MKSNASLMWKTKADLTRWLVTLGLGTCILFLGRMSMAICEVEIKEEFDWTDEQLGRVMSVFFWGYATTQVLGGSAADLFGGDTTIIISSFLWGTVCFLTPFFTYFVYASLGATAAFYVIILLRIVMGMSQGIWFPSLSSLLARRVADTNRSFSMSFVTSWGMFGTLLCGFIGSMILEWTSWKFVFNFFGLLGVCFGYFLYDMKKKQKQLAHRVVSLETLEDSPLLRSSGSLSSSSSSEGGRSIFSRVLETTVHSLAKVRSIFYKKSFLSLIVAHMASTNYTFILSFWLPKFFFDKYKSTNIQPWHYNVIPWIGVIPGGIVSGVLSDALVKRTNLSLTSVRKIIEIIALVGSALALHPLTNIDSDFSVTGNAYEILSYTQNYFNQNPLNPDSHGKNKQQAEDTNGVSRERRSIIGQGASQSKLDQKMAQIGEELQKETKGSSKSKAENSKNKIGKNANAPKKGQSSSNVQAQSEATLPVSSALFYICLSVTLMNFHNAAAMVNPQDLAPQNAGSVFGLMNMMGAVSSSFGIWFTGYLLDQYDRQWGLVFSFIITYNLFGGVVYFLFGTGKRLV